MSPSKVLADPAFQSLPVQEQLKVMQKVDPAFASLPAKDQGTVIAKSRQKSLGQNTPGWGRNKLDPPLPAIPKDAEVLGAPVMPAGEVLGSALGYAVDKVGEKLGTPSWANIAAGLLVGSAAHAAGGEQRIESIVKKLMAATPEERAVVLKQATKMLRHPSKAAAELKQVWADVSGSVKSRATVAENRAANPAGSKWGTNPPAAAPKPDDVTPIRAEATPRGAKPGSIEHGDMVAKPPHAPATRTPAWKGKTSPSQSQPAEVTPIRAEATPRGAKPGSIEHGQEVAAKQVKPSPSGELKPPSTGESTTQPAETKPSTSKSSQAIGVPSEIPNHWGLGESAAYTTRAAKAIADHVKAKGLRPSSLEEWVSASKAAGHGPHPGKGVIEQAAAMLGGN